MKSLEFYNRALGFNSLKFYLNTRIRFLLPFSLTVASLILGCSIYLFCRDTSNIIYHFSDFIGVTSQVNSIRDLIPALPSWFVNSLPDGLWMFSFSMFILVIWEFQRSREAIAWILIALACGFILEFFQFLAILPGQFDWHDLAFMFYAALLPFCFTHK